MVYGLSNPTHFFSHNFLVSLSLSSLTRRSLFLDLTRPSSSITTSINPFGSLLLGYRSQHINSSSLWVKLYFFFQFGFMGHWFCWFGINFEVNFSGFESDFHGRIVSLFGLFICIDVPLFFLSDDWSYSCLVSESLCDVLIVEWVLNVALFQIFTTKEAKHWVSPLLFHQRCKLDCIWVLSCDVFVYISNWLIWSCVWYFGLY